MSPSKPATAPRYLRVFLASPGDVAEERIVAQQVLDQLSYDAFLRGKVSIEIVAWDKPGAGTPMLASMDPQEAIAKGLPKPSECDIVVVVFGSRMGTLLSNKYVKPEKWRYLADTEFNDLDARYLSGTEWEYFNALEGKETQGHPDVLVYRRTETPPLDLRDLQFDEKRRQWKLLEAFFGSFRNPDGSQARGWNAYKGPEEFGADLKEHLKQMIKVLLETPERLPTPDRTATTTPIGKTAGPGPDVWRGSPFPGLRVFTEQDAPIFFGRGHDIDALIGRLSEGSRFIAVVGASGSGKSSLVWAGLIPRLLGQVVPSSGARPGVGALPGSQDWIWLRFTPGELGDDPFLALSAKLSPTIERQGKTPREVARELASDPDALGPWVKRMIEGLPEWAELLLFVDQFEELLTIARPEHHQPFADLLNRAAQLSRVRIILTLRADFYHRCLDAPSLRSLFDPQRVARGHYPLMAPRPVQLHEMIVRPAERAGLNFEPGLVDRILADTGAEPGALALMAFALSELYQSKTPGGDLTGDAYRSFGGVHGAIGKRASATFDKVEPGSQAKLGEVFRDLVTVDEHGVATRRRAPLSQVAASEPARVLVDALTRTRLLVTGHGEGGAPVVEVAHEALFRSWPLLEQWIGDTADDLRLRRQIEQLAAYWEKHGRIEDHRWPDNRVVEAANMLEHLGLKREDLTGLEQEFLGPLDTSSMLTEIENPGTSHQRRALIGVRLSLLGDPRPGVGLDKNGLPDIEWCEVPEGEVTLEIQVDDASAPARAAIDHHRPAFKFNRSGLPNTR